MYVSSINPGVAAAAEGRWFLFTEADLHQSLFHHYCFNFVPLGIYNPQLLLPCDFTKKHFFQEPHAHIVIHSMNTKQCASCRWPGCQDAPPTGLHSLLSVPWAGSRDPPTPALRDPTHRKRPPKPIQTPANIVCIECNWDLINTLRFVLYCHWRNWEQNQDSQWV